MVHYKIAYKFICKQPISEGGSKIKHGAKGKCAMCTPHGWRVYARLGSHGEEGYAKKQIRGFCGIFIALLSRLVDSVSIEWLDYHDV